MRRQRGGEIERLLAMPTTVLGAPIGEDESLEPFKLKKTLVELQRAPIILTIRKSMMRADQGGGGQHQGDRGRGHVG